MEMIIKIGRGPKNDIVLDNPTVSRDHATLEVTDGRILITDLGSRSGTYLAVGDKFHRATYHEVKEHHVILFGNERCQVGDLIRKATEMNREVVYRRNPFTGEITKE